MMNKISLKGRVMTRVYLEYAKNTFLAYPDYFMFALFVVNSFILVSFRDVLNSIPKDSFPHAFNFFVVAVENTSWILQILIAGFFIRVIVAGAMLVYKNFNLKFPIAKLLRFNKIRY